jgi:hypothetical protein
MRTINILLFPGLPLFRLDYKYYKPESTTGSDYGPSTFCSSLVCRCSGEIINLQT